MECTCINVYVRDPACPVHGVCDECNAWREDGECPVCAEDADE